MKKEILITGIIFLFVGVGIQPAFAVEPVIISNVNKAENTNPKEYLFQTIIDIANNPEVKDFLNKKENKAGFLNFDYNFRAVFLKLLLKNPRILFSMLFNKPSKTHEFLGSTYNKGCKIVNIIGEDEAYEITESITITNPEFFEELNNIIMKNEELSNRIATLKEMNNEISLL